jgi:hypothetical protein
MKAQIGIEYMVVVSLIIVILIPMFYLANQKLESARTANEARIAMNTIVTSVNTVYAQSPGSMLTSRVFIPNGYNYSGSFIVNRSIVMDFTSAGGDRYVIEGIAKCNVSGKLPPRPGYYLMTFNLTSYGNVSINTVTS